MIEGHHFWRGQRYRAQHADILRVDDWGIIARGSDPVQLDLLPRCEAGPHVRIHEDEDAGGGILHEQVVNWRIVVGDDSVQPDGKISSGFLRL